MKKIKSAAQEMLPLFKGGEEKHFGWSTARAGLDVLSGFIGAGTSAAMKHPIIGTVAGFAASALGHYFNVPTVQSFGVGLAVGPVFDQGDSASVTVDSRNMNMNMDMDGESTLKGRLSAFGEFVKKKFMLDKMGSNEDSVEINLSLSEQTADQINGLGTLDMSALDAIEQSIVAGAISAQNATQDRSFSDAEILSIDHI